MTRPYVAIVGHEAAKFTPETEAKARGIIRALLENPRAVVVSGHCHLGGIDIWAEEEADALGREKRIFPPETLRWFDGFKPRNIQIAETCTEAHCLVVKEYHASFAGKRFSYCYHCKTTDHIKSGGCWTVKHAEALGKPGTWWVVG
ncbi:MAG TPA: hypothetical protein VH439_17130 [Gemmatimonadales bacterium]